jgi:putative hemolysin
MDASLIPQAVVLLVLLLFSAYFSGSETAFFSLSYFEQDTLKRTTHSPKRRKIIGHILDNPDGVLITILTGNMLVNVTASSLAERLGEHLFPFSSELLSIAIMTLLLLLIGEMTPKNLAVRRPLSFAQASSLPLYGFYRLLAPLRLLLQGLNHKIGALFNMPEPGKEAMQQRIILSAVQIGFKEGILHPSELHMAESFFAFRGKAADEVMIPRAQINGIEATTSVSRLLAGIRKAERDSHSSLIPVYARDRDHFVGYLDVKDLLPFRFGMKQTISPQELLRPFISVPASKNCAELLVEMRETRREMALVIDEYGGTAGIVTFQDLVEELLGYFYPEDEETVTEIEPGHYRVAGSLELDNLAELLETSLPAESRTVAGLIMEQLGEIPAEGRSLRLHDLELTVVKADRKRILAVEVRKVEQHDHS